MSECTCELILTVEEPDEIELSYVEAEIKPEQTKDVVPAETPQTVEPDPGFTLGAVNVEAIPPEYIKPAGKIIFTENVTGADIKQYAEAEVAVPPPILQQKTVTPTESEQNVTADSGYDALSRVTVERIPSEYIVPSGKITLTENATDVDVSQYAAADIAVPVPVMPEEYCVGGSYFDKTLEEYVFSPNCAATSLPTYTFNGYTNLKKITNCPTGITSIPRNFAYNCTKLQQINLPSGLISIDTSAFENCSALVLTDLPENITTINQAAFLGCSLVSFNQLPVGLTLIGINTFAGTNISITEIPIGLTRIYTGSFSNCKNITELTFRGSVTQIDNNAFASCTNCLLYNFSNCNAVPKLNATNAFWAINANCKIVVPDSLVTAWKTATNWVTYADKIIGESDYNAQS